MFHIQNIFCFELEIFEMLFYPHWSLTCQYDDVCCHTIVILLHHTDFVMFNSHIYIFLFTNYSFMYSRVEWRQIFIAVFNKNRKVEYIQQWSRQPDQNFFDTRKLGVYNDIFHHLSYLYYCVLMPNLYLPLYVLNTGLLVIIKEYFKSYSIHCHFLMN